MIITFRRGVKHTYVCCFSVFLKFPDPAERVPVGTGNFHCVEIRVQKSNPSIFNPVSRGNDFLAPKSRFPLKVASE